MRPKIGPTSFWAHTTASYKVQEQNWSPQLHSYIAQQPECVVTPTGALYDVSCATMAIWFWNRVSKAPPMDEQYREIKAQEILWYCWIQIWHLKRLFRCEKGRSGKIAHFPLCAIREIWENSQTRRPSAGVRYSPDSKRNGANFSKEQLTLLCQAEGHELRQRQAAS